MKSKIGKYSVDKNSEQIKEEIIDQFKAQDDQFLSLGFIDILEAIKETDAKYELHICSKVLKTVTEYYGYDTSDFSLMNCLAFSDDKKNTVCIIDDSLINDINNFETLRQLSNYNKKLIIIYLDKSQFDKQVKIYDRLLSSLRATKAYINLKENIKNVIRPIKNGDQIIDNIHKVKDNVKKSLLNKGIFDEFNIDYIGPLRSKDHKDLIKAFNLAFEKDYSVLLHCIISSKNEAYLVNNRHSSFMEESNNLKYTRTIAAEEILDQINHHRDIYCINNDNKDYGLSMLINNYPKRVISIDSSVYNMLDYAFGLAYKDNLVYFPLYASDLPEIYAIISRKIDKLNKPFIINIFNDDNEALKLLNNLKNTIIYKTRDYRSIKNIISSALDYNKPTIIINADNCLEYYKDNKKDKIIEGKWNILTDNNIDDVVIISEGTNADIIAKAVIENELKYTVINAGFLNPLDKDILDLMKSKKVTLYLYESSIKNQILEYFNVNEFKGKIKIIDDKPINILFQTIGN